MGITDDNLEDTIAHIKGMMETSQRYLATQVVEVETAKVMRLDIHHMAKSVAYMEALKEMIEKAH